MPRTRRYMQTPHDLEDDERFADLDDAAWGLYFRLRNLADVTYPDPAPVPAWASPDRLQLLARAGLLVYTDRASQRIRLPELEEHRGQESEQGRENIAKRWGERAPDSPVYGPTRPAYRPGTTGRNGTERNGTIARGEGTTGALKPLGDILKANGILPELVGEPEAPYKPPSSPVPEPEPSPPDSVPDSPPEHEPPPPQPYVPPWERPR